MKGTQYAYSVTKYFPNQNPEKSGLHVQVSKRGRIQTALHTTGKQRRRLP